MEGLYGNLMGHGGFHKWWYPQMDGLSWKILLKWMINRVPHFRKPPYGLHVTCYMCCALTYHMARNE